jgi:putative redox protein
MRDVSVRWASGKFAQTVQVAGHRLESDEVTDVGGEDRGPTPHELVLGGLGACTAMTLKMYAERKGWPLTDVHVALSGEQREGRLHIARTIALSGALDGDQRRRLIEIADKCPVHKSLSAGAVIQTREAAA